jgi:dolichol-phosphate mannosyltransferase
MTVVPAPDSPPHPGVIAGWRRMRRVSSRVASFVRSGMLQDKTPDTGCGLILVRRETFPELP